MPPVLNDLQLENGGWRQYEDINVDSLWIIPSRDKSEGQDNSYHGNFVPQIPRNFIRRFTRAGDIVLDFFCGSGTTLVECLKLGRRGYAFDIKSELVDEVNARIKVLEKDFWGLNCEACVIDSANTLLMNRVKEDLLSSFGELSRLTFLHPPYWNIIQFSDDDRCLSNCPSYEEFLEVMTAVAVNAEQVTEPGGHVVLVIGDAYKKGRYYSIGIDTIKILEEVGLELRQIIPKNMTGNERVNGGNENLWRYRHLKNGTFSFKHEYIALFRRRK